MHIRPQTGNSAPCWPHPATSLSFGLEKPVHRTAPFSGAPKDRSSARTHVVPRQTHPADEDESKSRPPDPRPSTPSMSVFHAPWPSSTRTCRDPLNASMRTWSRTGSVSASPFNRHSAPVPLPAHGGPREVPSDATRGRCVLRLCSAVPDWHDTGRRLLTRNDGGDRTDSYEKAPCGTEEHEKILLIRWSQVRILPGAPQNPRSDGVRHLISEEPPH